MSKPVTQGKTGFLLFADAKMWCVQRPILGVLVKRSSAHVPSCPGLSMSACRGGLRGLSQWSLCITYSLMCAQRRSFESVVIWTCFVMHVGFVKDWNSCEKSGGSPAEHRRSVAGVDGWGSKGRGLSPGPRLLGE